MSSSQYSFRTLIITIVAAGALAALTGYWVRGRASSPAVATPAKLITQAPPSMAAQNVESASQSAAPKADSVEVLADRLRKRLEQQPDDRDGWVLLGRSYHFLERYDDASAAFARARNLGWQGDDDTAMQPATATAGSGGSQPIFTDIAAAVQDRAEQLQSVNPQAPPPTSVSAAGAQP